MLQLLKLVVAMVFAAAVLYIPHPVTGNLRGTPEGVCYLRAAENSTKMMLFIESDDYNLYNNSDGYKYEFHSLLRFE